MGRLGFGGAVAAMLLIAAGASAQEQPRPGTPVKDTINTGGKIVSQPATDVGATKKEIPPVLQAAHDNPYGLGSTKSCAELASAIGALSEALGPDFTVTPDKKENKAGKLAEAGGKSVVNAIIPFRGLVREISGAAPQQRRLNEAIDAGYARRGFLRGLQIARGCRKS